jgi:TetR/AcrR family transcriptional regulator, mexJK operon transcriptional repressor
MSRSPAPSKPAKAAAPGRPKDLEKGAAILEAAKRLFTTQGFDGTSMDQVAAAAGVSKLTVYSHFGDKESLFAAGAKAFCEQKLPTTLFEPHPEIPVRERLLEIARAFFAMVSSPEAIAGHRILCTPQMADSSVPRMFWEAGPQRVQAAFAELLRWRVSAGELEIEDIPRAAAQFFTLLKGEPHAQLVFGCGQVCHGDVASHLTATVDFFLRAYGPGHDA